MNLILLIIHSIISLIFGLLLLFVNKLLPNLDKDQIYLDLYVIIEWLIFTGILRLSNDLFLALIFAMIISGIYFIISVFILFPRMK
jgi:hypothetical protein